MNIASQEPHIATQGEGKGLFAPLGHGLFRRIWTSSLLANLGLMIQSVGSAWAMTQMTGETSMVALVQTALMLPMMLWTIPAGAIADIYDRRYVILTALFCSIIGASLLSAAAIGGLLTPWLLLALCFTVGSGLAIYAPAWQASVAEQVPSRVLPQAIALNATSFNAARGVGPAIGGIIVAAAGASAAFVANAVFYLPLLVVLLFWKREPIVSRLPPEGLGRALASGVRYVWHSPQIRFVMIRSFLTALAISSLNSLMPVIARDQLSAGAKLFGILLGAFGVGAVSSAFAIGRLREILGDQRMASICILTAGGMILVVQNSHFAPVTIMALLVAGSCYMLSITLLNIGVQTSVPRWVTGRSLAAFQASVAGGLAIGSWIWGEIADAAGLSTALGISAATCAGIALLGRRLPVPEVTDDASLHAIDLGDVDVQMELTGRSGPIAIERRYRIAPDQARAFYRTMQKVGPIRQRNGAFNWSIARDIEDVVTWIERYHCPTWNDYRRLRGRMTAAEMEIHAEADAFHIGPGPVRTLRMLERPFGSVRWREDAPDLGLHDVSVPPVVHNG